MENKGNLRNEENYQKAILKLDNFEKMIRERKIEKEYGEMMANFIKDENNNKILSIILNKNEYDYFINYIKENYNNNNKNVDEFKTYENENPLLINKNEINNILYNNPFKNEKESGYNIDEKSLKIKMNSNIVIVIKNEDNLNTIEHSIKDKKENIIFYLLNKCSIIFHTNFRGKEPYIIYDEILCGEDNIKIDYKKLMDIKSEKSHQKNDLSENNFFFFF